MNTPQHRARGFTVIELVLVIVILCILGSLVALTYSGVQAKNRNAERQANIDGIKAQLENFYAQTNTYPTLANLNDAAWRTKNMPHLASSSLQDPKWNAMAKACTVNGKPVVADKPAANCYSYQVTGADGSTCDNAKVPCAHNTLTALLEGGEKYVKTSLN